MILITHILFSAIIIKYIKFLPLALVLAFLSHYLLDSIPHQDYSIKNIKQRHWSNAFPDFLEVFLDVFAGFFIILLFSDNALPALLGGFMACLPDFISFLGIIFPSLKTLDKIHKKIHWDENEKVSLFWKTFFQLFIILLSILVIACL